MIDPLTETWRIHQRILIYLINALSPEQMAAALKPGTRTVTDLFTHLHNVRLMWLKSAAPELLEGLVKLEAKREIPRETLIDCLDASAVAIETLVGRALASNGRIKGFKPHATAFLIYLVAHESHHRGQIEYLLRIAGAPLSDAASYGVWEWGTR